MFLSCLFFLRIRGLGFRYLCLFNMVNLKGSVLVILVEGVEEMEVVIIVDVFWCGKVSYWVLNLLVYLNYFGDNFENFWVKGF